MNKYQERRLRERAEVADVTREVMSLPEAQGLPVSQLYRAVCDAFEATEAGGKRKVGHLSTFKRKVLAHMG